jgi:hypothetical protein
MGFTTLQLKLPTDYTDDILRNALKKQLGYSDFTFQIEKKSLDARNKNSIHWLMSIVVSSNRLKGSSRPSVETLTVSCKKRSGKVIVAGSGPAGFFAANILQMAGFSVTILERGSEVEHRNKAITELETRSKFSASNNYAFGEGGAGTFSDGKLTSRSKHISAERSFILSEYIKAGAPEEIGYMTYPHVGTDNLKIIVTNLRKQFQKNGGSFLFDTRLEDLVIENRTVKAVKCSSGELQADHVILATGHSAYDTYRMLIARGIQFGTKNFAIGHRIEHPQQLINLGQWGRESLPGVKAAEYRLSSNSTSGMPVYTFCMCPGGIIVPAAAFDQKSVVNGMSYFMRDGGFSNAGCVAGVHPDMLIGHKCSPTEILDWMDKLEEEFYAFKDGLVLPACTASDYVKRVTGGHPGKSSYPLGIQNAPLYRMVPEMVSIAIAEGIMDFSRKIRGFESGILMGLENKTSSPIQVVRERNGKCAGFGNLYFVGEGSGYSGGIISSAADGIRCAMALCEI